MSGSISDFGSGEWATAQLLRPRLVRILADRFRVRVLILRAGAGFGKTVALRHAMRENEMAGLGRDLWVPVRDCGARPDLVLAQLASQVEPVTDPSVESLCEVILGLAPEQVCISLDDVHLLNDVTIVVELLDRLPSNGHLCLASRHDLSLSLARLRAADAVIEIHEDTLSFTASELDELATRAGLKHDTMANSGGWPAHAALMARGGATLAEQFMQEEVLKAVPENRRRDLASWVSIGRADPDLMAATIPDAPWREMINEVPLVDVDETGAKLHDLWAQPLSGVLTNLEVRAVRARAANHLASANPSRAIELWREAQAWPELMAFFRDCTLGLHDPPRQAQLVETLAAVPSQFEGDPACLIAKALASLEHDPAHAFKLYQQAAAEFRVRDDPQGEMAALLNVGDIAQLQRLTDELSAICSRAGELASGGDAWMLDAYDILRVMEHRTFFRPLEGLELLEQIGTRSDSNAVLAMLPWLRASLNLQLGRPTPARVAAMEALESKSATVRALATASLGWALWLEGDREGTLSLLPVGTAMAEQRGDPSWIQTAAVYFAWALFMTGDFDHGDEMIERAHTIDSLTVGNQTAMLCVDAVAHVCHGREDDAAKLLDEHDFSDEELSDMMRRTAALWYVLRPDSRDEVRRFDGCYETAAHLGALVVAARNDDTTDLRSCPIPTPELVGAILPPPWAAELAIALSEAERIDEATHLVSELGAVARREVARLHAANSSPASAALLADLPPNPDCDWRIEVLGQPRLFRNSEPYEDRNWRRGRVRELLLYLIETGSPTRAEAMTALWPEFDEKKARRNLEVTLSYLTALLDGSRATGERPYFVRSEGDRIGIHRGLNLSIDLDEFESAVAKAAECESQASPSAALAHYRRVAALYKGPYLELKGSPEWTERPRHRVALMFVESAARAAELLTATGEPDEAGRLAQKAIATDPWHERSHRALVTAQVQSGNKPAARAALNTYVRVIGELGLEQPADIAVLVEGLARR